MRENLDTGVVSTPGRSDRAGPVIVLNSGSSSLKYQVVAPDGAPPLAKGLVDRIGVAGSVLRHTRPGAEPVEATRPFADHAEALTGMLEAFEAHGPDLGGLVAAGHRVVHGGTRFTDPVLVDDEVEAAIEELAPLAPLHNPANLAGLRALRTLLPDLPHVAVFDTAFHATLPPVAATYAIPTDLATRYGLRRYGFHGTSCQYVTRRAAELLRTPVDRVDLILCHLGNGASITAVAGGRSVDTSMGFTPTEGLVMGTRSGDLDPGVVFDLIRRAGMEPGQVEAALNHASGLRGLCGESDMRAARRLAGSGDPSARLALDVYAYRIRKYVGAYLAVVPGTQALVFTAGVGENDAALRAEVCRPLAHLGLRLDAAANATATGGVTAPIDDGTGPVRIFVVGTDEEAEIAVQTTRLVAAAWTTTSRPAHPWTGTSVATTRPAHP